MTDIVLHLAFASLLLGQHLIKNKRASGWAVRGVADATCVVVGCVSGLSSLAVWGVVFLGMDIKGWKAWRQEQ